MYTKHQMLHWHEKCLTNFIEQKRLLDHMNNLAKKGDEKIDIANEINILNQFIIIERRHIFKLKDRIRQNDKRTTHNRSPS